jgi:hypothetical protein
MKKKKSEKKPAKDDEKKPGDQYAYPPGEDIYSNEIEEEDIDVDDLTKKKAPNLPPGKKNEKSFREDVSGDDLDVPGSELDDEAERNGDEDEENNDYSLPD